MDAGAPVNSSSSPLPDIRGMFRQTVTMADRKTLTKYLLSMEKELQGYEAEVSRLKLAVLTLETKRNRLKKRMEEYKSLLAPIHKAPPEILHNIFTFCCDGTEFKTTEKPPAMALSTVCGRWREVFISTPSLWSSFSIHFSAWRGQYKALGCLTRAFLAHSQGSLLTLKLNLGDVSKESISSSQPLLRVLNSLIQSSTRWRWLELTTDVSILRHPVFDALRGHLPKLKDFHLTGVSCAREVEDGSEMDCFGNCPTLLNVTLQRTACGSALVLPWQQITTMQLHTIFSYDAIMFLKSCRNLTHLRLTETGEDDESEGGASLVADQGPFVSDVEDLSITAFWLDQVFFPFPRLTLPRLSTLEVCGLRDYPDETDWIKMVTEPIENFILRSACLLTSLHLKWLPLRDEQVLSLLRLMPTLKYLSLEEFSDIATSNWIWTPSFARHLTSLDSENLGGPSSSPPVVPRLTNLTMALHAGDESENEALLNMLTSRMLYDSTINASIEVLQSVSITVMTKGDFKEFSTSSLHQSLQSFVEAGLQIKISHLETY